jgi:hypothetical protein
LASSSLLLSEEWLDCLRDALGRAAEEERLCPAFWRVFCRVMSFSVRSPSNSGLAWIGEMGGGDSVVMGTWRGGERW